MEQSCLTVDELAAALTVSPKSIRRAYRKGEISVDRSCRLVRVDLERVKEAIQANGHSSFLLLPQKKEGQRNATGGARNQPRLGKTGASIAQCSVYEFDKY